MSNLQFHESGVPLTMSSREIAALTGKAHKNVIRDIEAMLLQIHEDGSDLSHQAKSTGYEIERDNRGYVSVIHLDRSHTYTLMTGYDAKQRKKLVDRWMELEGAAPREISREEQLARAVLLSNEMLKEKDEQISVLAPRQMGSIALPTRSAARTCAKSGRFSRSDRSAVSRCCARSSGPTAIRPDAGMPMPTRSTLGFWK